MSYSIAVFLVVLLSIFLFLPKTNRAKKSFFSTAVLYAGEKTPSGMTRENIEKNLKKLKKTPAPENLSPGAMCYEVTAPPQRLEYVCPDCGEKTLYAMKEYETPGDRDLNWQTSQLLEWELQTCRQYIKQIKLKIDAELIEKPFCMHCSPDAVKPVLGLKVTLNVEEKAHYTEHVTANDLKLLLEFLEGKLVHKGAADWETPLKDHIKRLEELLGKQQNTDDGEQKTDK